MPTESAYTQKFIKFLRRTHPEWFILKFNDRITRGIPDFCISNKRGKTLWLEAKLSTGHKPAYQRWVLNELNGKYMIYDGPDCYLQSPYGPLDKIPALEYITEYLK
jgi:hypothetical protein